LVTGDARLRIPRSLFSAGKTLRNWQKEKSEPIDLATGLRDNAQAGMALLSQGGS
jgi:hypothetical protein